MKGLTFNAKRQPEWAEINHSPLTERQVEIIRTMVDMYKESGWLPKWELFGRETPVEVSFADVKKMN